MSDTPTVALLGTGIMGAGMARNVLAAGVPTRVWNRSPDKASPLAEVGAEVASSPADAVAGADGAGAGTPVVAGGRPGAGPANPPSRASY